MMGPGRNTRAWLGMYKRMLIIRYFEERVDKLFAQGRIMGTAHLCVGQEAVAVGVCGALGRADYITSTHRGHGHFIARGGDPRRIMAELFGKATGYSGGRGGSQLMALYKIGYLGANGITGGGIPLATGVALSIKQRKTQQVVACFFGDGAANQGTFHESLNMAAIWRLPIVYICENNLYAMSTPFSQAFAIARVADRAASYGFPGIAVDGNDVLAVCQTVGEACRRARQGQGPTLIECKTYRFLGHSRGAPRRYRSSDEEKTWRRKDPITRFRRTLVSHNALSSERDARLRAEARKIVADAVRFARQSAEPDVATLEAGLFA